jgi:hypothetical protein
MDLLTTFTHGSELQAITAIPPNIHNSQITTALTKPFPSGCVLSSRTLATAYNSGDSSALRTQVLSSQPLLN